MVFRGRDMGRAGLPGRRRSVGLMSPDARCAPFLPPSASSRWCRDQGIICGTCQGCQGLVDTVLSICLAIGTRRLFVVALDLMGHVSLGLFPFQRGICLDNLAPSAKGTCLNGPPPGPPGCRNTVAGLGTHVDLLEHVKSKNELIAVDNLRVGMRAEFVQCFFSGESDGYSLPRVQLVRRGTTWQGSTHRV